jgi:hypothetical protein
VRPEALHHVGILVFDLDAAVNDFEAAMNVRFEPPKTFTLDGRLTENDGSCARELRLCYSLSGSLRIELIEAQPDGVWGRQHGEGFHHIGAWEADREVELSRHRELGRDAELPVRWGDDLAAIFLEPATLHGVRLELAGPFELPGSR